jgi:hypothetical protein
MFWCISRMLMVLCHFQEIQMSRDPNKPRPTTIQPRTPVPGQDPMVNPGYQPIPQDLPAKQEPDRAAPAALPERTRS